MKSFYMTLVLFLLLVACVAWNYLYINKVTNEMKEMLAEVGETIGAESEARAHAMVEYWDREEGYVGLSVEYSILDRVKEQALLLEHCARMGDVFGYHAAYAMLGDALEDLGRLEQFSIDNLF